MNNPLLSIVVPAYNVQKYIKKCLESIFLQTYRNIEVIVVNDGSTDNTSKILEDFIKKHQSNMRIFHVPNGGVMKARLLGVQQAQGEWIGFVDGDDEIESDMYEVLMENALKYNADISHCGYQMIFSDGRRSYLYNTGSLIEYDKTSGVKALLEGTLIEPGLWNKIFQRKLFDKLFANKNINTDIKFNEDLLMNYYLFSAANRSVFQDVCKYHYLIRTDSATRTTLNKKKIYDPIRVKKIICEDISDEMELDALRAYIKSCIGGYSKIMLDKTKQFQADACVIRKEIIDKKGFIGLLDKKQKILACMIIYMPWLYKPVYRFYTYYILKSKYD